jgi:hypothetical protein
MNKRAITPLISTILLVSFAVLLGVIVMNWGRTTYAAKEETNSCEESGLGIIEINEVAEICHKDGQMKFTIENQGQSQVTGFKISMLGETGIQQLELTRRMRTGDIDEIIMSYDTSVGLMGKIKIVPKITVNGAEYICPKNGVEIDRIALCEAI